MKEYYDRLIFLLERMPNSNTRYNRHKLSDFIAEYQSILNLINKTNEMYNRITNIYYSRINRMGKTLYEANQAKTETNKDLAFFKTVKDLKADVRGLADLIKSVNEA